MSTGEGDPRGGRREPTEEELRAAYEAEISKVRVEHVLLEQIVTLINLGMRRTGLVPGTESERDPEQVRLAIESIRALLPLLEQAAPQQISQIREALSQLQLAFVRIGEAPGPEPSQPSAPGAGAGPSEERTSPSQSPPKPGEPPPKPGEPPAKPGEAPPKPGEPPPKPGEPPKPGAGPAQRSGRLWVPGQ